MNSQDNIWKKGREFLGVKYPIISGGMTWVSNYELIKAVSDNGAFGVLAGGNTPPEILENEIDKCINGGIKSFAVNLITIAPNYQVHREIISTKNVPFVVFAGSFPRFSEVQEIKKAGKKIMAFASTESIAKQLIRFGVDSLILEGSEAGGHIGNVSLIILLQQVLFNFRDFPIFAAGGIASGRMIAHLLLMGAIGCQLGTRFVMTEECTAHPDFKKAFTKARAREAVATPQYDSKLPVVAVRAINNNGMKEFGNVQLRLLKQLEKNKISKEEAQYEVESYWSDALHRAVVEGDVDYGSLMAGQSVGLVKDVLPMKKLIEELVEDTLKEIEYVSSLLGK